MPENSRSQPCPLSPGVKKRLSDRGDIGHVAVPFDGEIGPYRLGLARPHRGSGHTPAPSGSNGRTHVPRFGVEPCPRDPVLQAVAGRAPGRAKSAGRVSPDAHDQATVAVESRARPTSWISESSVEHDRPAIGDLRIDHHGVGAMVIEVTPDGRFPLPPCRGRVPCRLVIRSKCRSSTSPVRHSPRVARTSSSTASVSCTKPIGLPSSSAMSSSRQGTSRISSVDQSYQSAPHPPRAAGCSGRRPTERAARRHQAASAATRPFANDKRSAGGGSA